MAMEHDPDDCHVCEAHKLDKSVQAAMEELEAQAAATGDYINQGRGLAKDTDPKGLRVTLDGSFNLRLVVARALSAAGVQVHG